MEVKSLIVDDFFKNPDEILEVASKQSYHDVISPYDGSLYPTICHEIPSRIVFEFKSNLQKILGRSIRLKEVLFRLTQRDYSPYQFVHTDETIAPYAAIVYLNKDYPEISGTEVMEPKQTNIDTQSPDHWRQSIFCAMKFNRLFVFRASDFHGALPRNGFGKTIADSRMIMIAWFF